MVGGGEASAPADRNSSESPTLSAVWMRYKKDGVYLPLTVVGDPGAAATQIGRHGMTVIDQLKKLRSLGGCTLTEGLPDSVLLDFAQRDATLGAAVEAAVAEADREDLREFLALDESLQIERIEAAIENFYKADAVNPYVALAARGPWIVTTKGAVLHDSGGYGMLGFGHAPEPILAAMNQPHVMANVMTPSFQQLRLIQALQKEIGRRRKDGCPFSHFIAVNSGSEAVSVASRFADINAKQMTDPGGRYAGRKIQKLSLTEGFHGRTARPAQFSHSTAKSYGKYLATFRDGVGLITVDPNDVAGLREVFARADRDGVFIEAFFMEPVMGEGNPGQAITPEFYAAARELTTAHGSLLLVDSIQAGLRATGNLSVVDSPGFETLPPPDMESYSKALNAGQYPMSILALTKKMADLHQTGVYGNTMTTNPRAMDVAVAVLEQVTDEVRANIVKQGKAFLQKLKALQDELGDAITSVQGTGLLFSCALNPEYKAYGRDSVEEFMRHHGIGVIHGGENSLRFTPHFRITDAEVDLIVERIKHALQNAPRRVTAGS